MDSNSAEILSLLRLIELGDPSARDRLLEISYEHLRRIAANAMRHERAGHTLQPTALIHEAVAAIFDKDDMPALANQGHFYGLMARAMKQILVDHARKRNAQRRGGGKERVPLDETICRVEESSDADLLSLDEALTRLEQHDKRSCEVVILKFFGGMEHARIANELGVSLATVDRDWRFARVWLKRELGDNHGTRGKVDHLGE